MIVLSRRSFHSRGWYSTMSKPSVSTTSASSMAREMTSFCLQPDREQAVGCVHDPRQPFAMNVLATPIPVFSQNRRSCLEARFRIAAVAGEDHRPLRVPAARLVGTVGDLVIGRPGAGSGA
jgi:hypothetical protein